MAGLDSWLESITLVFRKLNVDECVFTESDFNTDVIIQLGFRFYCLISVN